jgi:uncharacterized membrane protein YdjX (TVP38/TMEM64 family)
MKHDNNLGASSPGKLMLDLVVAAVCILALIWFGLNAKEDIKVLEEWIAQHGILGPIVFVAAVAILTSVFVPTTILSITAGALFGLGWGALIMIIGCMVGVVLDYWISNKLLSESIQKALVKHRKLVAIQTAVKREGMRFQLMLRLAPINEVMVNYALGSAGVRFRPYILTAFGIAISLFVEVYLGHIAMHATKAVAGVSEFSTVHFAITVGGFVACLIVFISIVRMAQRAIAEAVDTTPQ